MNNEDSNSDDDNEDNEDDDEGPGKTPAVLANVNLAKIIRKHQ